jgi:putative endonuclease
MKKTDWYLYLIRCRDGSIYTGISTNVNRRFAQHQKPGQGGSKYLRGRGPLVLVFQAKVGTYSLALKVECRVKKLPKDKKEKILLKTHYMDEIVEKASTETKN